jgi:alanyl-tRNA synthetase
MDANRLRRAFTEFFVERDHVAVPSAGLIPHHARAPLFTNAGMNQFIPYFLGEEIAPYKRATTVQKCVRIRGKHDDIELIGRTTRHLTFFEMLGNFSFGDYFKAEAIAWA